MLGGELSRVSIVAVVGFSCRHLPAPSPILSGQSPFFRIPAGLLGGFCCVVRSFLVRSDTLVSRAPAPAPAPAPEFVFPALSIHRLIRVFFCSLQATPIPIHPVLRLVHGRSGGPSVLMELSGPHGVLDTAPHSRQPDPRGGSLPLGDAKGHHLHLPLDRCIGTIRDLGDRPGFDYLRKPHPSHPHPESHDQIQSLEASSSQRIFRRRTREFSWRSRG